jgi:hypothetical protein
MDWDQYVTKATKSLDLAGEATDSSVKIRMLEEAVRALTDALRIVGDHSQAPLDDRTE